MSEPLDASMTDCRTRDLLWLPIDRLYPMLTVNKSSRVHRKYFQFAFNSPTFHLELTRLCENLLFPRTTLSSLASAASFSGERRHPRAKGKVPSFVACIMCWLARVSCLADMISSSSSHSLPRYFTEILSSTLPAWSLTQNRLHGRLRVFFFARNESVVFCPTTCVVTLTVLKRYAKCLKVEARSAGCALNFNLFNYFIHVWLLLIFNSLFRLTILMVMAWRIRRATKRSSSSSSLQPFVYSNLFLGTSLCLFLASTEKSIKFKATRLKRLVGCSLIGVLRSLRYHYDLFSIERLRLPGVTQLPQRSTQILKIFNEEEEKCFDCRWIFNYRKKRTLRLVFIIEQLIDMKIFLY